MIVCKFGGSSTAKMQGIKNIKILKDDLFDRKIFVFSALGKNGENDIKVTDILINCCNDFLQNKNVENYFYLLCKKFNNLKNNTNVNINVEKEIKKYFFELKNNKNVEYFISRGEYLTTKIMARFLKIKFIPAEKLIFFNKDKINYKKISKKTKEYLKKYKTFATCGFYGINQNKKIQLFSRGGGDITGAILSKCVNAQTYENWTDVDGVRDVNPNIVKTNKQLLFLSYDELNFMTKCDANVIHNNCVKILKNCNTQLCIGNIFNLQDKKSVVSNKKSNNNFIIFKRYGKTVVVYIKINKNFDIAKKLNLKPLTKNIFYIKTNTTNYKNIIKNIYQKMM